MCWTYRRVNHRWRCVSDSWSVQPNTGTEKTESGWISPSHTVLERLDKWGRSQKNLKLDSFHSATQRRKVSAFPSSEWFRLPSEKTDERFSDLWYFAFHIKYRLCNMCSEPLWNPNHQQELFINLGKKKKSGWKNNTVCFHNSQAVTNPKHAQLFNDAKGGILWLRFTEKKDMWTMV